MTRARWVPYAVVLGIGLLVAAGIFAGAERQPGIWMTPPLVLTAVVLSVMALSDRRREDDAARSAAESLGLRDTGAQTLPPLAPFLRAAEPPRILAGHLGDGTPVRVAHARLGRRGSLAVAMTEVATDARIVAGAPGAFGADDPADPELTAWLEGIDPGLGLVTEGGTLVVGRQVGGVGAEPPFALLLDAVREARARLA